MSGTVDPAQFVVMGGEAYKESCLGVGGPRSWVWATTFIRTKHPAHSTLSQLSGGSKTSGRKKLLDAVPLTLNQLSEIDFFQVNSENLPHVSRIGNIRQEEPLDFMLTTFLVANRNSITKILLDL